ncbi:L-histidine N-alpha-methyltransferase [Amycolatopsis bartoniae]|uniref:Histidine N-alpha-methyltransferase n=1 Tax=Amycolatopsis bartoniae TaxID=941986 RepID=A0A8H9IX15_9PSEU|nr:L-histidine N(alpha)-methyltransferase [Amycolatopsis bartoniae]MBB2936930.1 L-histidine N-alpha-methyltransferase [Amycolatopsis bartoniae]TVT01698.1 L-histidine N(alpha)-methyltransferase [Amycolatopsis bartoniae]GHF51274.1 histidine N-alpha-methyltransferase [Amycolatopsis bartoniae]
MSEPELEVHRHPADLTEALRTDVRSGFSAAQKWLPPKWFYDARGSELFEEITALPEYYPTRAEREVLAREAGEIARVTGARTLVELGSGSSEKTRLLLDGLRGHGTLETFVPQDVSASALAEAVAAIRAGYPGLAVRGVVGDFTEDLGLLPGEPPRVVAFLGGTIGNFSPAERGKFLRSVRAVLAEGEWLLLGTDLVKDPGTLVRAYDDAAGVTAEFNRNMLRVVNDLLGADFDPARFAHEAYWDPEHEWIEMRLRATEEQTVRIPGAGLTVSFAEGEYIRTEISAKFRAAGVAAELAESGFAVERWWTDAERRFGVSLSRAVREE